MVTIVDYHVRTSSKDGKEFIALELQGDFELIKSEQTGRYYATAKRCSISSTFTEEVAKQLIGTKYPGSIIRVEREAYQYVIPETGESITLTHGYEYKPEKVSKIAELPMNLVA
ncbi:MAG TPA: hypothetical protein VM101_11255 [Flavitalea sp.]|nr:hypothetical protein [Flavitalea sp.]